VGRIRDWGEDTLLQSSKWGGEEGLDNEVMDLALKKVDFQTKASEESQSFLWGQIIPILSAKRDKEKKTELS